MSGRDFKAFLASHQYQIGRSDTRLVNRFLAGSGPGTYKDVDFEKLQALAKIKRSAGQKTLKKLEKIEHSSVDRKEKQLLSDHKAIWRKEYIRLKNLQRTLEEELDFISSSDVVKSVDYAFEIATCAESLRDNQNEFEENTIQPVRDLRDDLIYWLQENREKLIMNIAHEDHSQVMSVVQSVKLQQREIMEKLDTEEEICEDDLLDSMASLGIEAVDFKLPAIETGIPEQVKFLYCPDETFKNKSFEEFIILDNRYASELQKLEEKYKRTIEKYPRGGWSLDDHLYFVHILEQYASVETANRRKLYLDRMCRELSHFTRKELVEHETWWFDYKSFGNQMKDLINAWLRDREDLIIKLNAIFSEYTTHYQHKLETELDHRRQKEVCEDLHKKLHKYRSEREEVMRLEAACKEKEEQAMKAAKEHEERKEVERRTKIKKKINTYHVEKQHKREIEAKQDAERLTSLKAELKIQRLKDLERIKFREDEYQKKLEDQQRVKEERAQGERDKEERLERLRAQVRVEAEIDPSRLLRPTEATTAHVASNYDDEKELQEPLFNVYTYNVHQIGTDKRLRMEQALRNVGLHNSAYARHILSTVDPPTKPRRDQKSTIFRD